MRTESAPRAAHQPFVKFIRPTAKVHLVVRPMVNAPVVSRMHRICKRSIPCLPDPCPFCAAMQPLDSRIYLLAVPDGDTAICFVDLPASHYAQLADLHDAAGCLSKYMLKISRLAARDNAPIGIRPVGRFAESADVFLQAWIEAVLDRNFSWNTANAIISLECPEKPITTFARSERSVNGPSTNREHRSLQHDASFVEALKRTGAL